MTGPGAPSPRCPKLKVDGNPKGGRKRGNILHTLGTPVSLTDSTVHIMYAFHTRKDYNSIYKRSARLVISEVLYFERSSWVAEFGYISDSFVPAFLFTFTGFHCQNLCYFYTGKILLYIFIEKPILLILLRGCLYDFARLPFQ